jgi:hypothetical protein
MKSSIWQNVTTQAPCPICHKPDWCSRTTDGHIVRCNRAVHGGVERIDRSGVSYRIFHLTGDGVTK